MLNGEKLNKFHTDLIRSVVKAESSVTIREISDSTGLNVSTCQSVIEGLIRSEEILELNQADSSGDIPSGTARFVYNKNFLYIALVYAGLDNGKQFIFISLVNLSGESLYEDRRYFHEVTVYELEMILDEIIHNFNKTEIISIGVPGVVHNGIIGICELEKLEHTHLQRHLSQKLGKIITIENDVNSAALGYFNSINSRDPESLVYIYYAENALSGAGIIVNGRVLKGRNDFAGEISFLPLGVNTEKQKLIQKNTRKFLKLLNKTILSINCLINPESIVICCKWFTAEHKEDLLKIVSKSSPEKQNPEILFESDMHDSYLNGLKIAGMQQLSNR